MTYHLIVSGLGTALLVGISLIGVRMLFYWWSFAVHWNRYRQRRPVSTAELRRLPVPYVKIQVTTRGSAGSTEVILRGIRNVVELAAEDPAFYGRFLSVEVVTESDVQAHLLRGIFARAPVAVDALVLPSGYRTRRPGRTFVVHYDEESVMVPAELRKLVAVLAGTDKKLLEGPIYYPLEYV